MAFFILPLLWILPGVLVGTLALLARLKPVTWSRSVMLALVVGAALLGGLLDTWLAGRLFSIPAALWVAVLASCAPRIITSLRMRQLSIRA